MAEGDEKGHVCLLGATLATNNMGVRALTDGATECIKKAFPDMDVILFDYAKEPQIFHFGANGHRKSVALANIRFSKKAYLPNNIARLVLMAALLRLVPFKGLRSRVLRRNKWLRIMSDSYFVAALAGGDSFSDIYGIARLLYVSLPMILPLLLKKKLLLLPQTYGPFHSPFARMMARYILRNATMVFSRDHKAGETIPTLFRRHGKVPEVRFGYDLAFAVPPARPHGTRSWHPKPARRFRKPLVGLNISGLLFIGGYTRSNMFGLQTDYSQTIQALCTHLLEEEKARIMLVPHVIGTSEHRESDTSACRQVMRKFAGEQQQCDIMLVDDITEHREIKYAIGQCDFFIGSRMHSCIAAFSQAVPAVGLAYSDKFQGVLHSIGMADLVVDLRTTSTAVVLERVGKEFSRRKQLRQQLENRMPAVREQARGLLSGNGVSATL